MPPLLTPFVVTAASVGRHCCCRHHLSPRLLPPPPPLHRTMMLPLLAATAAAATIAVAFPAADAIVDGHMDAPLHIHVQVGAKFWKIGVRWSQNDVVVSWLRL